MITYISGISVIFISYVGLFICLKLHQLYSFSSVRQNDDDYPLLQSMGVSMFLLAYDLNLYSTLLNQEIDILVYCWGISNN